MKPKTISEAKKKLKALKNSQNSLTSRIWNLQDKIIRLENKLGVLHEKEDKLKGAMSLKHRRNI